MLHNDSKLITIPQDIFAEAGTDGTVLFDASTSTKTNVVDSTRTDASSVRDTSVSYGNFDSPAEVPEFREALYLKHQTYIFENCLVEDLQRTVGSGLVPLNTRPGVTRFLTENDILSDKPNSYSAVKGSASNKVFVERLKRAGYFRNQTTTTLYRVDEGGKLKECTDEEIAALTHLFCKLGSMVFRRVDKATGKAVDIAKERGAADTDGYTDYKFFVPSPLVSVHAAVRLVKRHVYALPVVSIVESTVPSKQRFNRYFRKQRGGTANGK